MAFIIFFQGDTLSLQCFYDSSRRNKVTLVSHSPHANRWHMIVFKPRLVVYLI